jgi:hypothetical protein
MAVAAQTPEDAIKAGFLYRFAPFITWPARSFAAPDSPLRICVTGTDPFGAALADPVKGLQVDGHPVVVDHPDATTIGRCHILFAGAGPDSPPADMLHAVANHPVLTVTDHGQNVSGGMIEFMMLDGRVRFMIDAGQAEKSGLQISSKLLELAVKVTR